MPFTFSHPAIVLPLTFLPRKWFSLTGLVIGSLTPDFEYFIRMRVESNYSHTLSGLFWFDLPLGILLAFIFHNMVRDNLFDNLPILLKSRFIKFKQFDWNDYVKYHWLVVIISVIIGAASHLLWDSFTHDQGYFTKTIPELTNRVYIFGKQVPTFKFVQHISTILGAVIIALVLINLTSNKNVTTPLSLNYWFVWVMLTLAIISIRLLSGLDYKLIGHVIVTAISAGLISFILTPILTRQKITDAS